MDDGLSVLTGEGEIVKLYGLHFCRFAVFYFFAFYRYLDLCTQGALRLYYFNSHICEFKNYLVNIVMLPIVVPPVMTLRVPLVMMQLKTYTCGLVPLIGMGVLLPISVPLS